MGTLAFISGKLADLRCHARKFHLRELETDWQIEQFVAVKTELEKAERYRLAILRYVNDPDEDRLESFDVLAALVGEPESEADTTGDPQ